VRKVAGENPANKSGTTADRRGWCFTNRKMRDVFSFSDSFLEKYSYYSGAYFHKYLLPVNNDF
jgi:hypothetical protein